MTTPRVRATQDRRRDDAEKLAQLDIIDALTDADIRGQMSIFDILYAREARASIALDRDQTHTVE